MLNELAAVHAEDQRKHRHVCSGGFKYRRPRRSLTKRASTSMLVPQVYFRKPWASPAGGGVKRT